MKLVKSDWAIVRDAEATGLVAAMTSIVQRNRCPLNEQLSAYFRRQMPTYHGMFGEEQADDVLDAINDYLKEKEVHKRLEFPLGGGTEVYLIPITGKLDLNVLVVDEYYGAGDFSKYVEARYFVIHEGATEHDVDMLIQFVQKHLSL